MPNSFAASKRPCPAMIRFFSVYQYRVGKSVDPHAVCDLTYLTF